jgi:hypothetical protein
VVRAAGLGVRGRWRRPEAGAEGGEEGGLGHGGGGWGRGQRAARERAEMERDLEKGREELYYFLDLGTCLQKKISRSPFE